MPNIGHISIHLASNYTSVDRNFCIKAFGNVTNVFEITVVAVQSIGADLPGAVGADAPIDGRLMGAVHPPEKWNT